MKRSDSSEHLAAALGGVSRELVDSRLPGPRPAFSIAISREAGARGALIAKALGQRLGWPVYDRELLQTLGSKLGVHTSTLESVDEKHKGWLRECLEAFATEKAISGNTFVRHVIETMLSLAARGECVLVGRGAPFVLPAATTLRVRVVASLPFRIEAIRHEHAFSREQAERWVQQTDRERARFVQEYFNKDAADPRYYDLALNSERLGVDGCVELIIEALRRLREHAAAPPPAPEPAAGS
jgi:cytidylate kinase